MQHGALPGTRLGHNYMGHNYIDHNYIYNYDHNYIGAGEVMQHGALPEPEP